MTVTAALSSATRRLTPTSDSPRLDAEVLLATILSTDRTGLLTKGKEELTSDQAQTFQSWVGLHSQDVPVAYLTGYKDFYGFRLRVTPDVLIPRPTTELLVDEVRRRVDPQEDVTVVDVGTGSGAIALAVATSLPRVRVVATDVSPAALSLAHYNIRHNRLTERVTFLHGSLLEPFHQALSPDVIVANLPYLRTDQLSEPSIQSEPRLALDGGADGLKVVWQFLDQLPMVQPLTGLVLELDPSQVDTVASHLAAIWPHYDVHEINDGSASRGIALWTTKNS